MRLCPVRCQAHGKAHEWPSFPKAARVLRIDERFRETNSGIYLPGVLLSAGVAFLYALSGPGRCYD
jgi:hypothetical protein